MRLILLKLNNVYVCVKVPWVASINSLTIISTQLHYLPSKIHTLTYTKLWRRRWRLPPRYQLTGHLLTTMNDLTQETNSWKFDVKVCLFFWHELVTYKFNYMYRANTRCCYCHKHVIYTWGIIQTLLYAVIFSLYSRVIRLCGCLREINLSSIG